MKKKFTYYDLLGLDSTANIDDIKAAYHTAILKHHPDVNSSVIANDLTVALNHAYEILEDETLREKYNQQLVLGSGFNDNNIELWWNLMFNLNPLIIFIHIYTKK